MTNKKPLNEGNIRGVVKGGAVNRQDKPVRKPIALPQPLSHQQTRVIILDIVELQHIVYAQLWVGILNFGGSHSIGQAAENH